MDIVSNFKIFLQNKNSSPSKLTIKNYLSDIRRFLNWYHVTFQKDFKPEYLTYEVIQEYRSSKESSILNFVPSARSVKRYISSLRNFADFLIVSGSLQTNPFTARNQTKIITDPFYLKEFSNFLYTEQASSLTIKNYIADVKQFLAWLEKVTIITSGNETSNLFSAITAFSLENYKTRLYHQAQLSPVSINRKLSSIRRYMHWLSDKGILSIAIPEEQSESTIYQARIPEKKAPKEEIPLTALQGLGDFRNEKKRTYSPFPPIRLFQKTTKVITLGADLLFFNPVASSVESLQFSFWKKGRKSIFAPVKTILDASSYVPQGITIKTIVPKEASIQPPRSANPASVTKKIITLNSALNPDTVKNYTKAFYAPLTISTEHMHWKDKLLYHLRYTRPGWYRKYNSLPFINYLHYGIMMLVVAILVSALYHTWNDRVLKQSQAVLSARATAPPRTLAFQGRLLDSTNTPITAETPLRFTLYNSPTASGTALLWQEEKAIKPDRNGNFSTILGGKSPIQQNLFTDNPNLYIGITVGTSQELSPRQQIPTVGQSADAQSVDGLKPITNTSNEAQNVLLALDSAGNLTIGGSAHHTFQATGSQMTLSGQTLLLTTNPGSNENVVIAPDGSGIIDVQKPLQNTSNYTIPYGIPGSVEVADNLSVLATESSQSALLVNQNGAGDIISGRSNGIDKFRVEGTGNTFIGGDLILNGDTIDTTSNVFDIGGSTVNELNIGSDAFAVSIGGRSGATTVNNSLNVSANGSFSGNITANGGIAIPDQQYITLDKFPEGAIPFINDSQQIVQDANNLSWNTGILTVGGSICITNPNMSCANPSGSPTPLGPSSLQVNGSILSRHADLAENYASSQNLEPGDVVVLEGQNNTDAVIKSVSPYQKGLLGIVSTNPGFTLNSQAQTDPQHPNLYPLALQGRVPVKVSAINGPIQPGDDLTSSIIPGVAMKATGTGQIIGKALESYASTDPQIVGEIMTFVNLSYRPNPVTLTDNGNLPVATESAQQTQAGSRTVSLPAIGQTIEDIAGTIALGAAQAQTITSQTLQGTTDTIMIGGLTLKEYITALVDQLVNQEIDKRLAQMPQNQQIVNPVATNSAVTSQTASSSASQKYSGSQSASLQNLSDLAASSSSPIYNSIATPSAAASDSSLLASDGLSQASTLQNQVSPAAITDTSDTFVPSASISGELAYVPDFKADFATFNQGVVALGPTSLTDVSVSNLLTINNNLRISQNAINTLGSDLNIQPLRQGNVLFMGGLVAIDTQGDLNVNGNAAFTHNVTVNGQLAAGIIAPIPDQDIIINLKNKSDKSASSFIITSASGSAVLKINQSGDITSSGTATFNSVASNGFSFIRGAQADTSMTQTIANSSAGNGIITAYETERTIITPYVTNHSLIYITAASDTGTVTPYLARQTVEDPATGTKGSFTVAIPTPVTKDISFNWWIAN